MTQDFFQVGSETFIAVTAGGSVFYFVKGALRSSSKGCRLASGVEEVITNAPLVRRWAAWSALFMSIETVMVDVRRVHDPWNNAAAWGGANALFAVNRGTRAAIREGLKGAAYSVVAGLAVGFVTVLVLLKSPDSSD